MESTTNILSHFATIVTMAFVDGLPNADKKKVLFALADKLNIYANQFAEVVYEPSNFPIKIPATKKERGEYLYDLFEIIYADHEINDSEKQLIYTYVIGLGFSPDIASQLISKSMEAIEGKNRA